MGKQVARWLGWAMVTRFPRSNQTPTGPIDRQVASGKEIRVNLAD